MALDHNGVEEPGYPYTDVWPQNGYDVLNGKLDKHTSNDNLMYVQDTVSYTGDDGQLWFYSFIGQKAKRTQNLLWYFTSEQHWVQHFTVSETVDGVSASIKLVASKLDEAKAQKAQIQGLATAEGRLSVLEGHYRTALADLLKTVTPFVTNQFFIPNIVTPPYVMKESPEQYLQSWIDLAIDWPIYGQKSVASIFQQPSQGSVSTYVYDSYLKFAAQYGVAWVAYRELSLFLKLLADIPKLEAEYEWAVYVAQEALQFYSQTPTAVLPVSAIGPGAPISVYLPQNVTYYDPTIEHVLGYPSLFVLSPSPEYLPVVGGCVYDIEYMASGALVPQAVNFPTRSLIRSPVVDKFGTGKSLQVYTRDFPDGVVFGPNTNNGRGWRDAYEDETIEFWVKLNLDYGQSVKFFETLYTPKADLAYSLTRITFVDTGIRVGVSYSPNNNWEFRIRRPLVNNVWHHIKVDRRKEYDNNAAFTLYVDGVGYPGSEFTVEQKGVAPSVINVGGMKTPLFRIYPDGYVHNTTPKLYFHDLVVTKGKDRFGNFGIPTDSPLVPHVTPAAPVESVVAGARKSLCSRIFISVTVLAQQLQGITKRTGSVGSASGVILGAGTVISRPVTTSITIGLHRYIRAECVVQMGTLLPISGSGVQLDANGNLVAPATTLDLSTQPKSPLSFYRIGYPRTLVSDVGVVLDSSLVVLKRKSEKLISDGSVVFMIDGVVSVRNKHRQIAAAGSIGCTVDGGLRKYYITLPYPITVMAQVTLTDGNTSKRYEIGPPAPLVSEVTCVLGVEKTGTFWDISTRVYQTKLDGFITLSDTTGIQVFMPPEAAYLLYVESEISGVSLDVVDTIGYGISVDSSLNSWVSSIGLVETVVQYLDMTVDGDISLLFDTLITDPYTDGLTQSVPGLVYDIEGQCEVFWNFDFGLSQLRSDILLAGYDATIDIDGDISVFTTDIALSKGVGNIIEGDISVWVSDISLLEETYVDLSVDDTVGQFIVGIEFGPDFDFSGHISVFDIDCTFTDRIELSAIIPTFDVDIGSGFSLEIKAEVPPLSLDVGIYEFWAESELRALVPEIVIDMSTAGIVEGQIPAFGLEVSEGDKWEVSGAFGGLYFDIAFATPIVMSVDGSVNPPVSDIKWHSFYIDVLFPNIQMSQASSGNKYV